MKVLSDSVAIMGRLLRNLARQPWWIAISLAQPATTGANDKPELTPL